MFYLTISVFSESAFPIKTRRLVDVRYSNAILDSLNTVVRLSYSGFICSAASNWTKLSNLPLGPATDYLS